MIYLGIDPGKEGGIVGVNGQGIRFSYEMPVIKGPKRAAYDVQEIVRVLEYPRGEGAPFPRQTEMAVFVEQQQAMPAALGGAYANFARGEATAWEWLFAAMRVPFQWVRAQGWQKQMLEGTPASYSTKQRAAMRVSQLWPGHDFIPAGRRKPHEGIIDAALIAEYGRRKLGGA